jgi:hypothetical protein
MLKSRSKTPTEKCYPSPAQKGTSRLWFTASRKEKVTMVAKSKTGRYIRDTSFGRRMMKSIDRKERKKR